MTNATTIIIPKPARSWEEAAYFWQQSIAKNFELIAGFIAQALIIVMDAVMVQLLTGHINYQPPIPTYTNYRPVLGFVFTTQLCSGPAAWGRHWSEDQCVPNL